MTGDGRTGGAVGVLTTIGEAGAGVAEVGATTGSSFERNNQKAKPTIASRTAALVIKARFVR
jgi:hypothetical protein